MRQVAIVLVQTIVCSLVACSPPVGALGAKDPDEVFWRRVRYNMDAEREVSEKVTNARVRHGVRPLVWLSLGCQMASMRGLQFVLYEDNWLVYRSEYGPTGFVKVRVSEDVKKSFVALTQKTANIAPKRTYRTTPGRHAPHWQFCSWLDRVSMRPKEFAVEGSVENQPHNPFSPHWQPEKLPESVLDLYQAIVSFQDKTAEPWVPSDSDIQLIPKVDSVAKQAHRPRWPSGLSYTMRKRAPGDEHIRLKPDFGTPYKILELDRLLESQSTTGGYLVLNGRTYLASWVPVAKSLTPEQEEKEFEYSKDPDQEKERMREAAECEKLSKPLRRNPKADVYASPGVGCPKRHKGN